MKKLFKLSLALLTCLSLAACAKTNEEPVEEAKEPVEVVIWHTYTEDQEATLQAAADAFNASQETITVKLESQAYQDFTSKVMQAVRNQNGPDMIIHYASEAANYVDDGLVIDFDQYLDADYKSTLSEAAYNAAHAFTDGKMHIYPLVTSGPIFFYNKTIYDELNLEVPTTWTQLAENAKAIYDAKGIAGFAFDSLTDGMQTLITQAGSGMINSETKSVEFNTPESVERLQWFADNVKSGAFLLAPTGSYFSEDMNSGILASYIGSVAGLPYLTLPEGNELGMAELPQEGAVQWVPGWDRGAIVFSSTPEKEAAMAEFVKFFAGEEWNTKFCVAANYASPYTTTQNNADYKAFLDSNPALKNLRTDIAGSFANIAGASTVRDQLKVAATEAATGTKTAEQALTDAETTSNAELQSN